MHDPRDYKPCAGHGEPSEEFVRGQEAEINRRPSETYAYKPEGKRPRVNDVLRAIEIMDAQQLRSFTRRFEKRGLGKIIWSEDSI